jgi:hypothetical protein
MLRITLILLLILSGHSVFADNETLTNESVIKMVKAGLGSDLILEKIQEAGRVDFDLSTDALVALKEAKVSDEVIRAMKTKQQAASASPAVPPPAAPVETAPPAAPAASAGVAQQFDDAQMIVKAPGEEKPQAIKGTLVMDPEAQSIRFIGNGVTQLDIPYKSITGMLYERTAKPRYGWGLLVSWPLLFTKSKSHYFTIQYKNPAGAGDFAIIRLHKKNYQMALATVEAQTSMKIERTEER